MYRERERVARKLYQNKTKQQKQKTKAKKKKKKKSTTTRQVPVFVVRWSDGIILLTAMRVTDTQSRVLSIAAGPACWAEGGGRELGVGVLRPKASRAKFVKTCVLRCLHSRSSLAGCQGGCLAWWKTPSGSDTFSSQANFAWKWAGPCSRQIPFHLSSAWTKGWLAWAWKKHVGANSKPHDIMIYMDGSVTRDWSGWGFAVKQDGRTVHQDSGAHSHDLHSDHGGRSSHTCNTVASLPMWRTDCTCHHSHRLEPPRWPSG